MTQQTTRLAKWLFAALLLCGVAVISAPRGVTARVQLTFLDLFDTPLAACKSLSSALYNESSPTGVVSESKYIRLRNHLANNLQLLSQQQKKIEKLSGLSDRFAWQGTNFILAGVITRRIDASRAELIIDRGAADGLSPGQFVLAEESIIGSIADLDLRTARVRLITDPAVTTPVELANGEFRALMNGAGKDGCAISLLPAKLKIEAGDVIYARKSPGLLDNPVIAAVVSTCRRDDQHPLFWQVTAQPACDIQNLEEVAIIITRPADETALDNQHRILSATEN
jgi:rod shape-determining protein MreC